MRRKSVVIFIVSVAIPLMAGCSVNPVTGKKEFTLLSVEKEIEMGKENYPVATQMNNGEYISPGLKSYVNRVGQKLARNSHRPEIPYEFNVVNSSDINAYALPGGKISITRGMLEKMKTEGELAAVLGHEIGHVAARHSAQAITRGMLFQTALTIGQIAMEVKDVKYRQYYAFAGNIAASLVGLKYSRKQESQADELGLTYMIRSGYHPDEFSNMLDILKKTQKREPYRIEALIQSHPLTRDRLSYAKDWIRRSRKENPHMDQTLKRNTDGFNKYTTPLKEEAEAYKHYDTAEGLVAKKKYRESIPEYQKAIQIKRKESLFHSDLAWVYNKLGNYRAAESEYDKAVYYNPDLFKARFNAGEFFLKRKNYTRALSELRAAENILPRMGSVHYLKGLSLEGMRRYQLAIQEYNRTLQTDPEGPYGAAARKRLERM